MLRSRSQRNADSRDFLVANFISFNDQEVPTLETLDILLNGDLYKGWHLIFILFGDKYQGY